VKNTDIYGSTIMKTEDLNWMSTALKLATEAASLGEVPVGAVLVLGEEAIGFGKNQMISNSDPTAHAEIIALRQAAKHLKNYRLINTTLYVTLEPCSMCLGAMLHARIKRLVFGAYDPKTGAVQSVEKLLDAKHLNHRVIYQGGVMENECSQVLKDFFKHKRSADQLKQLSKKNKLNGLSWKELRDEDRRF